MMDEATKCATFRHFTAPCIFQPMMRHSLMLQMAGVLPQFITSLETKCSFCSLLSWDWTSGALSLSLRAMSLTVASPRSSRTLRTGQLKVSSTPMLYPIPWRIFLFSCFATFFSLCAYNSSMWIIGLFLSVLRGSLA